MKLLHRREFLKVSGAASVALALGENPRSATAPSTHSTHLAEPWIEIDLSNMAWNLAQIRARVGNRPVMAVIKANAYGHGLVEVGKFLEKQKVEFLAVGKFQEALQLREGGVGTPILNLGSFSQEEAEEIVRLSISQSVYTDEFKLLAEAARKLHKTARVHFKVDTGLGRIGVPHGQALPFLRGLSQTSGMTIEGIFTPFTEDEDYDRIQLQRFQEVCHAAQRQGIPVGMRHAASSAGVLSFPEAYLDMVRPGIMLYGEYPSVREYQSRRLDLRPIMTLKARVLYTKTLQPGDSVSYHRAFIATQPTSIATLATGYSDGYPPAAAGKAEVLAQGQRWRSIALVTSNHMTIDVTGAQQMSIGQEVVLLGKQEGNSISAEELAAWAGTSVYKILIGMNPLLPRIYLNG